LGSVAVFNVSGGVERWQSMAPPRFETSPHETPRSEAARQLQVLLGKAVERRVPRTTRTAIWLSGGYDSPAVYGAGRKALSRRTASGSELVPVSLSYPPGDRGREDELIREIAGMWDAEINWVNSQDIPLLAGIEDRARERDDPFAHPFEPVQRMLARAARACDCRVVLDGNGGDQAFSAADGIQADALQSGEWGDLYRQYRRTRAPFRDFARAAILPLLGRSTREWLSQLRGKELRGYWDTRVPDWMSHRESLTRAAQGYVEPEPGESLTAFEARFLLGHPHLSRVVSWAYAFGLDEGIVLRSPLLDLDVVEFIAGRPVTDRFDGASNKVLLRDSVRGLLPDSVLASRREKTGTPVDYVRREYREGLAPELRRVFGGGRRVRLVEMGVVLPDALNRAISEYERGLDYQLGHLLVSTMQAEWWIAGQLKAE
jgi:asparagine synthetase B (glutamine-hydrolysing)